MRRLPLAVTLAVTLALCIAASAVTRADMILTPAGLDPGDQFRVLFVTSGGRDATSSNIADYDFFVGATAGIGGGPGMIFYEGSPVTWYALGSTSSVSAISRLPFTSPPLYLADGTLIATSGADLWDGSIANPINRTEFGTLSSGAFVWTGTNPDGSAALGPFLGNPLPNGLVTRGDPTAVDSHWVLSGPIGGVKTNNAPLYGFSGVLTVPEAVIVPEPATFTLALLGIGGLGGLRLARRRRGTSARL